VVRTLVARPERMRAALDSGFTQAADLADLLMRRFGADYRTAHRVVQRAVRAGTGLDADTLARAASDVVGQEWRLDAADLAAALDPAALVRSRTALGGAAPSAMQPMLDRIRAAAGRLRARADACLGSVREAEDAVRAKAQALAGR
jgi:argininosuccinate lyase